MGSVPHETGSYHASRTAAALPSTSLRLRPRRRPPFEIGMIIGPVCQWRQWLSADNLVPGRTVNPSRSAWPGGEGPMAWVTIPETAAPMQTKTTTLEKSAWFHVIVRQNWRPIRPLTWLAAAQKLQNTCRQNSNLCSSVIAAAQRSHPAPWRLWAIRQKAPGWSSNRKRHPHLLLRQTLQACTPPDRSIVEIRIY